MMLENYYILRDDKPVVEPDVLEWARWFEQNDRRVALTQTENGAVSTVFLGMDHNFMTGGPPLLYETMIFGGTHDQYMKRYTTLEEAKLGHERAVRMLCDNTDK